MVEVSNTVCKDLRVSVGSTKSTFRSELLVTFGLHPRQREMVDRLRDVTRPEGLQSMYEYGSTLVGTKTLSLWV